MLEWSPVSAHSFLYLWPPATSSVPVSLVYKIEGEKVDV